jgi:hypothetical protein
MKLIQWNKPVSRVVPIGSPIAPAQKPIPVPVTP